MERTYRERRAFVLGVVAFVDGRTRVPALDEGYAAMLEGVMPGGDGGDGGDGVPVTMAWLRGWDTANLAAPVEGVA
jgi:hypothetical protein